MFKHYKEHHENTLIRNVSGILHRHTGGGV